MVEMFGGLWPLYCKEILWSGLQYNTVFVLFFFKFHFFQGGRRCSGLLSFTLSIFHCILAYYWEFSKVKNEICLMVNSSLEWRVLIASFVTQMVSNSRRLSEWYYFRSSCPSRWAEWSPAPWECCWPGAPEEQRHAFSTVLLVFSHIHVRELCVCIHTPAGTHSQISLVTWLT